MPEPLTDEQIEERYGDLFAEFTKAVRADPIMLVEFLERAFSRRRGPIANREPEPEPVAPSGTLAEKIDHLRSQGESIANVARVLHVSESTVKRLGSVTKRAPNEDLNAQQRSHRDSRILELAEQGLTISAIARAVSLSRPTVRKVLAA